MSFKKLMKLFRNPTITTLLSNNNNKQHKLQLNMIFCSPTVLTAIVAASGQNTDETISYGVMKLHRNSGYHSSSIVDISAMRGGGTAALTSTTDDNTARVNDLSGIMIHRRQSTTTAFSTISTISNEYEDVLAKYHRKQEDSTGTTAARRNGKSSFAYSPALQSYRH